MYRNGERFVGYVKSVRRFLDLGGVLIWGMLPTQIELYTVEGVAEWTRHLKELWAALYKAGIDRDFLLSRSLLSLATCCLVNPGGEKTVFAAMRELLRSLRQEFGLA